MKQGSNWFSTEWNQFEQLENSTAQRCNWSVRMKFMIVLRLSLISHYTHPGCARVKFFFQASWIANNLFYVAGISSGFVKKILWPLWKRATSSSAQFPDLKRCGHDIGHEKRAKAENVLGQTSPHVSHGITRTFLTFSFKFETPSSDSDDTS